MRNIKRWGICAILFIICLLILNYLNQGLKEGYDNCSMQPQWLFNNSNNLPPPYRYRSIR
jgi:preprotein translocase subunit SecG